MPAGLWARSASIRTISCSCDKESGVAEAVAAAAAAAVAEAEEDWERLELDTRFTAMARSNFGEYFGTSRGKWSVLILTNLRVLHVCFDIHRALQVMRKMNED